VFRLPEVKGVLYDYANGRYNKLMVWDDSQSARGAGDLIENLFNSGRDDIYVSVIKSGVLIGYTMVSDSRRKVWSRAFFPGIYEFEEAMEDTSKYCRKVADEMGYRRPE
jgi:hypothetical protein